MLLKHMSFKLKCLPQTKQNSCWIAKIYKMITKSVTYIIKVTGQIYKQILLIF